VHFGLSLLISTHRYCAGAWLTSNVHDRSSDSFTFPTFEIYPPGLREGLSFLLRLQKHGPRSSSFRRIYPVIGFHFSGQDTQHQYSTVRYSAIALPLTARCDEARLPTLGREAFLKEKRKGRKEGKGMGIFSF
jgi:hypothetical protein